MGASWKLDRSAVVKVAVARSPVASDAHIVSRCLQMCQAPFADVSQESGIFLVELAQKSLHNQCMPLPIYAKVSSRQGELFLADSGTQAPV